MDQTPPPPLVLYQIGTAYYASQALYVAAKLGIADHMDGPRTAETLASATGAHAPSLRRVLRLLVGVGVLVVDDEGRFSLTPIGAALRSGPGSSRSSVLLFAGPMQWKVWGDLMETVRTGQPAFERITKMDPWDYFASHPDEAEIFDQAMSVFTPMVGKAVASAYDFAGVRSVIDLGGGNGALMIALLGAQPHLRGSVFDLARVGDVARQRIAGSGLGDRLSFTSGDFFESVPSGYDRYLLKHVIHDWDDEHATRILRSVRRAMSPEAKVLIVEALYPARIDTSPTSRGAAGNDCNMLVATGGRQRSESELRDLYAAAGLRLARIVPTAAMSSVIEGVPM